jgi:hypothetical protein
MVMHQIIDPTKAVNFIIQNASKFAKAKSERVYIENFLRSKKSLLMGESPEKTMAGKEKDAYAHSDYIDLLFALKEAIEVEEQLKWQLTAAQIKVEIWRSQEATNRSQEKLTM